MRERVRSFLGVYAPMIVGLLGIALAVSFLLTPRPPPTIPLFAVDPIAAAACGGGVILVGAILILSTVGRWRKVRRARAEDASRRKPA